MNPGKGPADTDSDCCVISDGSVDGASDSSVSKPPTSRYLYRTAISDAPLLAVLEQVAPRIEGAQCAWFRFDGSSFRKMAFMRSYEPFLEAIRPCYFPAKWRKYGDKEITYNSFTTLLRQICNATGRAFYTKHVYDHSVCNTVYFVSAPAERLPISTV